jgi:hypothetical protein
VVFPVPAPPISLATCMVNNQLAIQLYREKIKGTFFNLRSDDG